MNITRDRLKQTRQVLAALSKDDHIWLELLDFDERLNICVVCDILERLMGNGPE